MIVPTADQRTPPRKRPRQARARHTVDAIIEAAARILEDGGHGGFNTNAVATLAGVSIGTLYQYFTDKDAVLGALIARETALLVDDVDAAYRMDTGQQALDALIQAAVRHQACRPRLARLLDFEEARLPLDVGTQSVRARFTAILADILSRPDLPRQSNVPVASADLAAIMRGMIDSAGERGEHEQQALAARVHRAVLGYLSMPDGACA